MYLDFFESIEKTKYIYKYFKTNFNSIFYGNNKCMCEKTKVSPIEIIVRVGGKYG